MRTRAQGGSPPHDRQVHGACRVCREKLYEAAELLRLVASAAVRAGSLRQVAHISSSVQCMCPLISGHECAGLSLTGKFHVVLCHTKVDILKMLGDPATECLTWLPYSSRTGGAEEKLANAAKKTRTGLGEGHRPELAQGAQSGICCNVV